MKNRDVLSTETELSTPGKKKKVGMGKRVFFFCLKGFCLIFFSLVISASVQITYDLTRYTPFFVSGMSMYPVLNSNSTYTDLSGNTTNLSYTYGNFESRGSYLCDYGLMDGKEGFIDKLNRFDIVCTYYPTDYVNSDVEAGQLLKDEDGNIKASLKIKRVIAFPGETIAFYDSGALSINGVTVEQPFFKSDDQELQSLLDTLKAGTKSYSARQLKDGEYFVAGDNRAHSDDSRKIGPISSKCFSGRAVAVIGKTKYVIPETGKPYYKIQWNKFLMPWNIQNLMM